MEDEHRKLIRVHNKRVEQGHPFHILYSVLYSQKFISMNYICCVFFLLICFVWKSQIGNVTLSNYIRYK